jgi:hypothetical protein
MRHPPHGQALGSSDRGVVTGIMKRDRGDGAGGFPENVVCDSRASHRSAPGICWLMPAGP